MADGRDRFLGADAPDTQPAGDPAMPPEAERYVAETERRAAAVDWSALRTRRDVAYGPDPHQRLDVFAPRDKGASLLPILVYIHGGGWTHGHRGWMSFMAPAITALPAVFVSPGYGLAPEHRHPAPVHDCLRAIAHARTHAADWGGDPDRLYLGGHSVGGYLSSLIALRPDLRARYGVPEGSIRACIPVSGLFRVLAEDPTGATDLDEASPVHWARNARMPFHVSWGEDDYGRIIEDNREFVETLRRADVDLRAEPLAGLDHYTANLSHGDTGSAWCRSLRALVRSTS